ncbi:hypothetical protein EHW67_19810 [Arenibacter aquaticus]|uniref:Uncharacterized protein n=1 Tax=Arenibacter aquaticus TaxID=2489054 RepID=A0A430K0C1_9FLAO|nr:hypothetical protein [Arenibacter aquaticus]RTE52425.1 hypothetical protein EHW67_19810 [Arenibacter aquaticus]
MVIKNISLSKVKKVGDLHWEVQQWKSLLQFMDDEYIFIERLLSSSVFKDNTPNLFERLHDFNTRLQKANNNNHDLKVQIARHENNLGNLSEIDEIATNSEYFKKNSQIQKEVEECLNNFKNLKAEVFNYVGGLLKKRPPQ